MSCGDKVIENPHLEKYFSMFPEEDWRQDVADGNTKLGYREWVYHNAETYEFDVAHGYTDYHDLDPDAPSYLNFYQCPCGEEWESWDSCKCNDRCPNCNSEIEPRYS